jgi:hypothetical protein
MDLFTSSTKVTRYIRVQDCIFNPEQYVKLWIEEAKSGVDMWVLLGVPLQSTDGRGILLAKFANYEDGSEVLDTIFNSFAH